MTPSQTNLMEQCRKEAEAKYPTYSYRDMGDRISVARKSCAQALYDERSKAKTYSMSKDYDALYDLLCAGGEAFCLVDMDWNDGTPVSRDVARIRRRSEWYVDVGARGIGYGDVRPDHKRNGEFKDERKEVVAMCKRLSLEWLAPSVGLTVDEVIAAGDELMKLMWEANDMALIGPTPSDEWHSRKNAAIDAWDRAKQSSKSTK